MFLCVIQQKRSHGLIYLAKIFKALSIHVKYNIFSHDTIRKVMFCNILTCILYFCNLFLYGAVVSATACNHPAV